MPSLTAAELLDVWERGQGQPPAQKALWLLAAAGPGVAPADFLRLPIGQRDAALLTLREWLFGPVLECVAACPQCGEQLELNFSTTDVRCESPPEQELNVALAEQTLRLRLPNSADLLAIAACADSHTAQQMLMARCVINGDDGIFDDTVRQAMAARLAEADPQADVQLALTCPACGQTWTTTFDIVTFLWSEITAWAGRLFREVHLLASAYGWREADILALNPSRRQRYLALAQSV